MYGNVYYSNAAGYVASEYDITHPSVCIYGAIGETYDYLFRNYIEWCNYCFRPRYIGTLNNPFNTLEPNNNILNSVTISVMEFLADERAYWNGQAHSPEDKGFYETILHECNYVYNHTLYARPMVVLHPFLPLLVVEGQNLIPADGQAVRTFWEALHYLQQQLNDHILKQIDNHRFRNQFYNIWDDIMSNRALEYTFLCQRLNKNTVFDANLLRTLMVIDDDGTVYKLLPSVLEVGLLDLLIYVYYAYLDTVYLGPDAEMFDGVPVYFNTTEYLCISRLLLQQLIIVVLITYYTDSYFISSITRITSNEIECGATYLDIVDQQYSIYSSEHFMQIDFAQFLGYYYTILSDKFYTELYHYGGCTINTVYINQPLLNNIFKCLYSDVGNKFTYDSQQCAYRPQECEKVSLYLQRLYESSYVQYTALEDEHILIGQLGHAYPALELNERISYQDIKVIAIKTTQFKSLGEFFHPNYHLNTQHSSQQLNQELLNQNMRLEQLRARARNFNKLIQSCRKNLLRRFRVNKNGNYINAECMREKKVIQDFETLKKKVLNNRENIFKKPRGLVRKSGVLVVNPIIQALNKQIDQKLDETEEMVAEIYKQFGNATGNGTGGGAQMEEGTGLNVEVLDQPQYFNGVLKHYQRIGFSWLVKMFNQKLNPLLCDQMGLGKTVYVIAFFAALAEYHGYYGPFLVVCPNSLLNNWMNEISRFADCFNVWPYWGSVSQRQIIRNGFQHLIQFNTIMEYNNSFQHYLNDAEIFGTKECPLHILITSYSLAVQDFKYLSRIPWVSMVLDEGYMIKSSETQRWRVLMKYQAMNKILLSGTPVQNSLDELWSLLHFVMPNVFYSRENFADWFGSDSQAANLKLNDKQLQRLHNILQPFVLRREKKDVANYLGEKQEKTIYCNMTSSQRRIYDSIKLNDAEAAEMYELQNIVMQLRKVVNHPQIFGRNFVLSPFMFSFNIEGTYASGKQPQDNVTENDEYTDFFELTEPTVSTITAKEQVQYKIRQQNSFEQELASIMNLLPKLYYFDKQCQARESYLNNQVYQYQYRHRVFEFTIPTIITELMEASRHGGAVCKCILDVYHTINNLTQLAGTSVDQVMSVISLLYSYANPYACTIGGSALGSHRYHLEYLRSYLHATPRKNSTDVTRVSDSLWESLPKHKDFNFYTEKAVTAPPVIYFRQECSLLRSPAQVQPRIMCMGSLINYGGIHTLLEYSGKLIALDRLLGELHRQQNQTCLVYCQMTRMMDVLEDYLSFRGYKYVRLDGSMSVYDRKQVVDRFMTDKSIFVFLLSTRAGSLGLNLTKANNVIFYESDWNPTSDQQASDRVHRIGYTRNVQIWRLVIRGSIDERIMEKASSKEEMQKVVLEGQQRDQYGNLIGYANKKERQRQILVDLLK